MGKWYDAAQSVRSAMDYAGKKLADADASCAISIYPRLKRNGALVRAGTRVNWGGQLKRAAVDLWDTAENDPEHAPTLWEDIGYKAGYRIIPATITAGTAFAKDELGWWNDELYRSKLDANVWTPEQYPAGWEMVVSDAAARTAACSASRQ